MKTDFISKVLCGLVFLGFKWWGEFERELNRYFRSELYVGRVCFYFKRLCNASIYFFSYRLTKFGFVFIRE